MKFLIPVILLFGLSTAARADLFSKAAAETTEFVLKKFGAKVATEGAEAMTRKLASAAARHGDDLLLVVRKVGPKAVGLVDEAGENAPRVLKFLVKYGDEGLRVLSKPQGMALFSRYGDDAARAMINHKGIAEPLIEQLGEPAVKALTAIGPQNGRRLAMMAGETSPEMLGVIGKYGDGAMDFIWRNKAVLSSTAVLASFLSDPEPYINGSNKLVETVAESTIKPTIEAFVKPAVAAVGETARGAVSWLLWGLTFAGMAAAISAWWFFRNRRKSWAQGVMRIGWKLLTMRPPV